MRYYRLLREDAGKISGSPLGKMKQFATYFTRGMRNGAQLRKQVHRAASPAEVLTCVDACFEEHLERAA